jgi:hypothetical protein
LRPKNKEIERRKRLKKTGLDTFARNSPLILKKVDCIRSTFGYQLTLTGWDTRALVKNLSNVRELAPSQSGLALLEFRLPFAAPAADYPPAIEAKRCFGQSRAGSLVPAV